MSITMEKKVIEEARVYHFNAEKYFQLIKSGIIPECASFELLDGLLVIKDRSAKGEDPMSIGNLHNLLIQLLWSLSNELSNYGCYLQTQGPVVLADNEVPEPDGAIVKGVPEDYAEELPGPNDILCVIEVADSSLRTDRTTKLRIYAMAGIPQYAIVNLVDKQIEVHELPNKKMGTYSKKSVLNPGDEIAFWVGKRKRFFLPVSKLLR